MPSLQYINTMNQIQLLVSLYHEIENKSYTIFFTRTAIPFLRSTDQYVHIHG